MIDDLRSCIELLEKLATINLKTMRCKIHLNEKF